MSGGSVLGAALAGALQGGGEAGKQSLQLSQEAQQKQDLVQLQAQLEMDKDRQIAAINQDYHVQNMQADWAHGDKQADVQRTWEGTQNAARNQTSRDVANTAAGAELGSARIRAAADTANNAATIAEQKWATTLAAQAPQISSMADGHMYTTTRDLQTGKMVVAPLKGPDGKDMIGPKNIDASRLAIVNAGVAQAANMTRGGAAPEQVADIMNKVMQIAGGADPSILTATPAQGITPQVLGAFKANTAGAAANFDATVGKANGFPAGMGAALATIQQKNGQVTMPDVWAAAGQLGQNAQTAAKPSPADNAMQADYAAGGQPVGATPRAAPTATPAVAPPAAQTPASTAPFKAQQSFAPTPPSQFSNLNNQLTNANSVNGSNGLVHSNM